MQKIGLLLPRSLYYASAGFDMNAGFKAALQSTGNNEIRSVTDNIGFGTDKQQVYRAAEKMLMDEDASIVFAYCGMRTAQLLRPLFMSANRLLVVLDSGASLPQEWPVSPNILYLSLHNSLGAKLASRMAARDGFKNGAMITNYYDAGYLHTLALTNGFTELGGTMVFNIATGYRPEEFSLQSMQEHLKNYPDACLLNLFSGDFAEWFFRDMKAIFGNQNPPAYSAPFMLDENMLARSEAYGGKMKGVATWSKLIDSGINQKFIESLTSAGREANLFSLLGWEAATISEALLPQIEKNASNGTALGEAMKSGTYETPRGTMRFHDATNTSLSPMFEADVIADENGHNKLQLTAKLEPEDISTEYEKMVQPDLGESVSGWFNSYTCN